jgi:hypothetical protein
MFVVAAHCGQREIVAVGDGGTESTKGMADPLSNELLFFNGKREIWKTRTPFSTESTKRNSMNCDLPSPSHRQSDNGMSA